MRKLFLAYVNEMIKIIKKPVVLILAILISLSSIIAGVVFNKGSDIINAIEESTYENIKEETSYEEALEELEKENNEFKNKINAAISDSLKENYQKNIDFNNRKIEILNLSKKHKIDLSVNIYTIEPDDNTKEGETKSVDIYYFTSDSNENNFINFAVSKIISLNESIFYDDYNYNGIAVDNEDKAAFVTLYEKYKKSIEDNDYAAYIDACNYELEKDKTLSEEDIKLSKEMNALKLKADPKGEYLADINKVIEKIKLERKSLDSNKDLTSVTGSILQTGPVLSPEERTKIENELSISMYKLEHGIYGAGDDTSKIINTFSAAQFFIIVLALLLAGSNVSGEITSGSIKTLIISPVKRWKLFAAKYFSVLTVGFAGMLIAYFFSILMNVIFNGVYVTSYVSVLGNNIYEINGYLFHLLYDMVMFVDVIIFSAIAFMLSIITRNTAVSVAMSLLAYFGGTIVNLIQVIIHIKNIVSGSNVVSEWTKFIPYNNNASSLSKYIFSYLDDTSISGMMNILGIPQTLWFVLGYMVVLFICIMYTAYDSFVRRDIK